MAAKKISIKINIDDPTIPTKIGPRFARTKFGPEKYVHVESLYNPPVYNGDEGVENVQREFMYSRNELDKTTAVTADKKDVMLSEGIRELDEQWDVLDKKENQFRIVVRKFNKFVKENLMKRERFENVVKRSKEQFNKYNGETEKMKLKTSKLKRTLQQMKTQIKKHAIYEDFLRKVVSVSIEFKTVYSFVSRFKVLIATLDDTTALFIKNKFLLLHLVREMNDGAHQKSFALNQLMNRLCKLGPTLNDLTTRNLDNEKIICDVHREVTKSIGDVRGTLDFMDQLYRYMCSREGKQALYSNGDYENQMMAIGRALTNFEKLMKICKVGV